MMRFATRRRLNLSVLIIAALLVWAWVQNYQAGLKVSQYLSGWLLFASMAVLALYGIRKKITTLPLLSNATWLQLHLYLGTLAAWLFLLHIDWEVPNGYLEGTLAILFGIVIVTGLVGIYMLRSFPERLTRGGDEVIFERIPVFRNQLREEAEDVLVALVKDEPETSLQAYYLEHLQPFFASPGSFFNYLFRPGAFVADVIEDLRHEERYFNAREREGAEQLRGLIRRKHNLERHYVYQSLLKHWLFVHVPVTYSMYLLVIVHVVSTYAFRGGI